MKLIFGFPENLCELSETEQVGHACLAGLQILSGVLVLALLICTTVG